MRQRLLIALLTAFGFAAGFGARMLTENGPAVPPPPAPGTEFVRSSTSASDAKERHSATPTYSDAERAKLMSQIQELRPKIDAYRQQIEELATQFERDIVPILTPEQREKFAARQKRDAERRAKGDKQFAEVAVLSDEQIFQLQQRPLWNALWNVAVTWRLDRLDRDLKLDEHQESQVRSLLQTRREKFLALVDSTPPPTITLSNLAPQAEKLASTQKPKSADKPAAK